MKNRVLISKLFLIILFLFINVKELYAAACTVTNTDDSGAGSLRQAITDANASSCSGSITFNISGGGSTATITPSTALPIITQSVTIDATTQGDRVELSGSTVGAGGKGFDVSAGAVTIKGFVINQWSTAGIHLGGSSDNNQILDNYIGLNLAATDRSSNGIGILVDTSGTHNYIGTDSLGNLSANVISGNTLDGIKVSGSTATIKGNYIGTQPSGLAYTDTTTFGNSEYGIYLFATDGTLVGGTSTGESNVISGNGQAGILFYVGSGNQIYGNFIGTDKNGTAAIANNYGIFSSDIAGGNYIGNGTSAGRNLISGNSNGGVYLRSASNIIQGNYVGTDVSGSNDHTLGNGGVGGIYVHSSNNTVGGTEIGEGNLVAFNSADGVGISSGNNDAILGNSIFSNTGEGINLNGNGNTDNATAPVINSVTSNGCNTNLEGSFSNMSYPNSNFRIEVFETASTGSNGKTFLEAFTITTDSDGNANILQSLTSSVTTDYYVTVTSTVDDAGTFKSTTPFSTAVQLTQNSSPGSFQFSSATYSVNENGGIATITVQRVSGSDCAASVDYATSNGTALDGVNYTATSGTLSWGNGDDSDQTFDIPILEDGSQGSDVTVNLTLTNPMGGDLGVPSSASLTIVDTNTPTGTPHLETELNCIVNGNEFVCTQTISNSGDGTAEEVNVVYEVENGNINSVELSNESSSENIKNSLAKNVSSNTISCDANFLNCELGNLNASDSITLLIYGTNSENFSLRTTVSNQNGSSTSSATASGGIIPDISGGGCSLKGKNNFSESSIWIFLGLLIVYLKSKELKKSDRKQAQH